MRRWYFTLESVTLEHPDKMCEFIDYYGVADQ